MDNSPVPGNKGLKKRILDNMKQEDGGEEPPRTNQLQSVLAAAIGLTNLGSPGTNNGSSNKPTVSQLLHQKQNEEQRCMWSHTQVVPTFSDNMVYNNAMSNKSRQEPQPHPMSKKSFPQLLFEIVSNGQFSDIIGWLPHGEGFMILDKPRFAKEVLPRFFDGTKFTSFTRRLKRWNFSRVTRGPEMGAYYNKYFVRGSPDEVHKMRYRSTFENHGVNDKKGEDSGMPKSESSGDLTVDSMPSATKRPSDCSFPSLCSTKRPSDASLSMYSSKRPSDASFPSLYSSKRPSDASILSSDASFQSLYRDEMQCNKTNQPFNRALTSQRSSLPTMQTSRGDNNSRPTVQNDILSRQEELERSILAARIKLQEQRMLESQMRILMMKSSKNHKDIMQAAVRDLRNRLGIMIPNQGTNVGPSGFVGDNNSFTNQRRQVDLRDEQLFARYLELRRQNCQRPPAA